MHCIWKYVVQLMHGNGAMRMKQFSNSIGSICGGWERVGGEGGGWWAGLLEMITFISVNSRLNWVKVWPNLAIDV